MFEQQSCEFGIFSLSKFKPSEDSGEVGSPFFGYFLWRSKESDILSLINNILHRQYHPKPNKSPRR
ncbi:hypothetical protein FEA40_10400 [Mannheimia haemolytica]|nr:hypothetical protein FEA40_10400 [Mannheimia haemolytica]TRC47453.1 hypothetical protein FEA32_10400 [Mannheimia haemolytica]